MRTNGKKPDSCFYKSVPCTQKTIYDAEADAMCIVLRQGVALRSKQVGQNLIIDYDEDDNIVAYEILGAKKLFGAGAREAAAKRRDYVKHAHD